MLIRSGEAKIVRGRTPGAAMPLWHYPQSWLKDVNEDAQQMPNA
jgi:hypothetical protein